jgi:TonB family protein
MAKQHGSRTPGRIGRGLLFSLYLHAQLLVPLVTWLFWWGRPGDDEVQVTFEEVKDDELPPDLPLVEKPPQPAVTPRAQPKLTAPPKPRALAERESEPPPTPQALKPEDKPRPDDKPKAEQVDLLHQKIVDLDMGKDVEEPKDAKYLAQRNNRTDHETRARDTNLDREQQGKPAEPTDEEEKVAHAEKREGKPGQRSPRSGEERSTPMQEPRPTLSMRTPGVERTGMPNQRLEESPDGLLSKLPPGRPARQVDRRDSVPETPAAPHLTRRGYASAFGDDSKLAAAVAKQDKSKHKGRFSERKEKVLAALENFINEVTPSNQTELNTRAAPFAQFITRMHRQIHEKFAFGFLTQMDTSFRNSPMDDMKLVAKLEIVLDEEGNVDKIAMVRTSGNTGFDVAAINSVYDAAPFPVPPTAILSSNGKVYLHWKFHRNGDACGTPGVNYFILDNGAKNGGKGQPRVGAPDMPPRHG